MTLVVTINGRNSIWLMADRRLSANGVPVKDDAHKIMFLQTSDASAILGYAGLGATAKGTEPADWMSNVLRGRNFPLENSLTVLGEALKTQFPRHMQTIPGHYILIPAFAGEEARYYEIDLFAQANKGFDVRYIRPLGPKPGMLLPPPMSVGGSGKFYLARDKRWMREVLRLVKYYDRNKVSANAVADLLAKISYNVHLHEKTVGPRCIVAVRNRNSGGHKTGHTQMYYTGTQRDRDCPPLPMIWEGGDIRAIVGAVDIKEFIKNSQAFFSGGKPMPSPDLDKLNAKLARLPRKPDEKLD